MHWLTDPNIWAALITLTVLEIVLGIDNVIFIAILAAKLPVHERSRARVAGLGAAMLMRVALLFAISSMMRLTEPLLHVLGHPVSGRDLLLLGGGLFLLAKATFEIHDKLEGTDDSAQRVAGTTFLGVIVQIMLLDVVFSLDSVITAVGMADHLAVMVAAVVLAVGVMMLSAGLVSDFVQRHPTVRMLALSFLLLIGMSLVAEGLGQHIAKGYIYFAMGFSVLVEMLNLRVRAHQRQPVHLRNRYSPGS